MPEIPKNHHDAERSRAACNRGDRQAKGRPPSFLADLEGVYEGVEQAAAMGSSRALTSALNGLLAARVLSMLRYQALVRHETRVGSRRVAAFARLLERERELAAEVADCVRIVGGKANLNPPIVQERLERGYSAEQSPATAYVVETTTARMAMAAHASVLRRAADGRIHELLQRHLSFERARRSFFAACMARSDGEPLVEAHESAYGLQ